MVNEPTPAGRPQPRFTAARPVSRGRRATESVAVGLAYGGLLVVFGACLVASFRPNNLFLPYWTGIPRLRTDTSGAVAFFVAGVGIVVSEGCRLHRRDSDVSRVAHSGDDSFVIWVIATGRAVAILAIVAVVYLSVNAVTHPYTLDIHATHFASWPTESTLRVVALLAASVAVGVLRFAAINRPAASTTKSGGDGERPVVSAPPVLGE
jgi:hypothetical protein